MKKDFDEHIKGEGGAYKLQPRTQVWERVAAELDAKKERKRFLWFWWSLPLALAGIWGGVILLQREEIQTPVSEKIAAPGSSTLNTHPAVIEKKNEQPNPAIDFLGTELATSAKPVVALRTPFATPAKKAVNREETEIILLPNINQMAEKEININAIESNKPKVDIIVSTDTIAKETPGTIGEPVFKIQSVQEVTETMEMKENGEDTPKQIFPNNPIEGLKDSLALTNNATKKQATPKNIAWRVVAGIGRHTYHSDIAGAKIFGGGLQTADLFNNPTSPGSSPSYFYPPKPGTGFMVGLERTQDLKSHPRWQWQAGLHYQYQTVRVSTGARKDSAISLENMGGSFSNNRTNFYYLPGSANSQRGHQHRFLLQAGIGWHLHKNKKWILQGLAFGGMVLGADYLVVHSLQTGFVPVNQVLQTGFWGLEAGVRFQPGKWGLGLYGQSSLSSSVSGLLNNQYWQGAELRVHYTLSSNK